MEGLEGRKTKYFRPRMILYTVLLLFGAGVLLFSLSGLGDATLTAWRAPGASYYVDEDVVRNQFMVRVTNTSNEGRGYSLRVVHENLGVSVRGVDELFEIDGNEDLVRPVIVLAEKDRYAGGFSMIVEVLDEAGVVQMKRPLEFIGPSPHLLRQDRTSP